MNWKVKFKDGVYKKLKFLMANIGELNGGKELALWFTGKWVEIEDGFMLIVDGWFFPEQSASTGEVEIDENDMISLIREYGHDKIETVKAHWHIHPFSNYKPNWSNTDDNKIEDFMHPEKDRDLFVFILSSKGEIVAKVVANLTANIKPFNKKVKFQKMYDDVEIVNETKMDKKLFKVLKSEIKKKVRNPIKKDEWFDNYSKKKESDPTDLTKFLDATTPLKVIDNKDFDCEDEIIVPFEEGFSYYDDYTCR